MRRHMVVSILYILAGIASIIMGLSGKAVLMGTDSGVALAVAGAASVGWSIYLIIKRLQ